MSNPIRFFEHLRDMYLRYLDSPFDIRYEDLSRERRELLDQDGRIYRYPLIEPVPVYRSSGQSFGQAAHILLNGIWQPAEIAGAAELVSRGVRTVSAQSLASPAPERRVRGGCRQRYGHRCHDGNGLRQDRVFPVANRSFHRARVCILASAGTAADSVGLVESLHHAQHTAPLGTSQSPTGPRDPNGCHACAHPLPPQCARGRSACPPAGSSGQPGSEKLAAGTPGREPNLLRSLYRADSGLRGTELLQHRAAPG